MIPDFSGIGTLIVGLIVTVAILAVALVVAIIF